MMKVFKSMAWYNQSEYLLMALMTAAIAINWHWGVWALALLLLNTLVKGIASHSFGNPLVKKSSRVCLLLILAFYTLYAVSTLYSCQAAKAWSETLITMAPIVAIPLIFLSSNMAYLRRRHIDTLALLFAGTLTLRFLVMLVRAVIGYCNGTELSLLIDFHFDSLHHNYLAMYLLSAVALLYVQLIRHWSRPAWKRLRWWIIADMLALTLYMVIMGSRSGLVILALLVMACMTHLAFFRRKWMATAVLLGALALLIGASYLAMPKLYWRILYSAQRMAEGQQGDSRQTIWTCGLEVLHGHALCGLGCDGYWEQLHQSYVDHNFAEGFLHDQYNTHNQYLETTLCTGMIGLLVLLGWILLPLIGAFRRPRNLPMVLFTIVYAGSLFFEVTLARQMGLLFVIWWYCLLLLIPQLQKSAPQGVE